MWQPIGTVPHNQAVILANFTEACLISGAPHVWAASFVTKWVDGKGWPTYGPAMWCEASHAATNTNGHPTHWMPLPDPPQG